MIDRLLTAIGDRRNVAGMFGAAAGLGLTFGAAIKGKSRVVRRLVGGVMTFGDGRLPVPLHPGVGGVVVGFDARPTPVRILLRQLGAEEEDQ